ncbi:hypothetical protein FB45DRAFT_843428 [Roridomyces roridus]|uniref:BTB domain-containing protein n=1 Tax=Roridomyces roridus TaxID=1738132 RepID=A0AAD7B6L9_9AGAR|nr:hypothetical protein FB45DRAFT_843428 [Roridomyces roridus]
MQVDDTPRRIPGLWFDDGNIVIQAGNSQFRVHRGILAARSPVFKDMLSFPQPLDSELVDGCPLVRLPDVEAEVAVFLRAIFDPDYFMPFPANTQFDILQGCLRLSHKYEVEYLRLRALVHLSSRFRTTLSEWDSAYFEYSERPSDRPPSQVISWTFSDITPEGMIAEDIAAIQLAREADAHWVLPAAFYRLSSYVAQRHVGLTEVINGTVRNGVPQNLSPTDRTAFLDGHTRQIIASPTNILSFLSDPLDITGCTAPDKCRRGRLLGAQLSRDHLGDCPSIPLNVWDEDSWAGFDEEICPTCSACLKPIHAAARQTFWDQLPGIYSLPPWDELIRMKTEAIGLHAPF